MTIRLMRTFSISSYVILSPEITRSPSSAENALSQSMLIAASYLCLCSMAVLHCAFVQGALMPTNAYSVSGALSCSGRSFQNSPLRECFVSQKAFRKSHSTPRHDGFHETRDVALQNSSLELWRFGGAITSGVGRSGVTGNVCSGATCCTGTVCSEPPAAPEARDDAGLALKLHPHLVD